MYNNNTNIANKYIKISLYTQRTATCFDQACGRLQGYKLQSLDTLKIQNETVKLSESINTFLMVVTKSTDLF